MPQPSNTESLSLSDNLIVSLNGDGLIHFYESISLTSQILPLNDEIISDSQSNIELEHNTIEINKPVIWSHNVTFSNGTDAVAVEIPADAEILSIKTLNDTSETILYNYTDFTEPNLNFTGLYDDDDISEKDLKKYFRLLDSVGTIEAKIDETNEKIAYYADLDTAKAHKKLDKLSTKLDKLENSFLEKKLEKLPDTVPLASLQQVEEMLQTDKPLKVLLLNNTDSNVELTFSTPAAYTVEQNNSTNDNFERKVTVAHESALHYTNVTAFTDIPEHLVLGNTNFKLFWNMKVDSFANNTSIANSTLAINSNVTTTNSTIFDNNSTTYERVDVTNDPRFAVEFVDTDNNGIADRMQWIVPQLSEQEFDIEADLEIINVQSYPAVGGTWKVNFVTNGTA